MILSGPAIIDAVMRADIVISPFTREFVNPASVDLRLGYKVTVYEHAVALPHDLPSGLRGWDGSGMKPFNGGAIVDPRHKEVTVPTRTFILDKDKGWVIEPGVCYLMHTLEKVETDRYVPVVDGKSSVGRLFIHVHITAGYGDPGYAGQYTLEVMSHFPVRVYPEMRICQMRFHHLSGSLERDGESFNYRDRGRYVGRFSEGAVASMIQRGRE